MNGAAAEHVREAIPVLAAYCDVLAIRAFADGKDLHADLAELQFKSNDRLGGQTVHQSRVSHESPPARRSPIGRRSTTCGVPAAMPKFVLSWVNHPRALPLAVPSSVVHMAANARHGRPPCCDPMDSRSPPR